MAAMDSKSAAAVLIDPMTAPEPSAETGPGAHFGSTFAPKPTTVQREEPVNSRNPFRDSMGTPPPTKSGVSSTTRPVSGGSPQYRFPAQRDGVRSQTPPSYEAATSPRYSPKASGHHRRTSSLKERFPGDESHLPLDIIRRDSKKAHRSPHLAKRHHPGADSIDKLDPAFGGHAYHHEGPYDAALLARNTSFENSPIAALKTTNEEALKATPAENVKDALDRHVPLDGVAIVPPGMPDRFGRTYNYEEGADLMHESVNGEPGYKRWADRDYHSEDLKGESEPSFSLDRALRAHKIDDDGIEMSDRAQLTKDYHKAERNGTLDTRDPVVIAGGQSRYVDLEHEREREYSSNVNRSSSLRLVGEGLKKRIGSLRKKNRDD
ncbi:hypothetical protein AMS68_001378 [Peltaster fructicola]|uniref:Pal1 cell morphology protein n=1 Tax=Peltaster fructicola TaxID=286661 RepID=A0A6H0XMJ1_9PEZI|nr:hypothetical protein AMS68_001378 [Peltaster fructicola]